MTYEGTHIIRESSRKSIPFFVCSISDDFGLRSPVVQKPFSPKKRHTRIIMQKTFSFFSISDDFGLRSPVMQKPFSQTKSATPSILKLLYKPARHASPQKSHLLPWDANSGQYEPGLVVRSRQGEGVPRPMSDAN